MTIDHCDSQPDPGRYCWECGWELEPGQAKYCDGCEPAYTATDLRDMRTDAAYDRWAGK